MNKPHLRNTDAQEHSVSLQWNQQCPYMPANKAFIVDGHTLLCMHNGFRFTKCCPIVSSSSNLVVHVLNKCCTAMTEHTWKKNVHLERIVGKWQWAPVVIHLFKWLDSCPKNFASCSLGLRNQTYSYSHLGSAPVSWHLKPVWMHSTVLCTDPFCLNKQDTPLTSTTACNCQLSWIPGFLCGLEGS